MATSRSPGSAITAREREVWSLVRGHLTNRQIADQLCVSVRTVESHVSSLIRKMQVADRRSLARHAGAGSDQRLPSDPLRWPVTLSSFVGREHEREVLNAAIAAHRLVTVTGPGGVGKTRLALHVAREVASTRRDGGWFVDLARVTDPQMVLAAVAATIGVAEPRGGSQSLAQLAAAALAGSDGVLVLDNCEHLIDAARACAGHLLMSSPSLTIVATSRARLDAPYEWVYAVPGLSVSDDGGDAVALFVDRATSAGATETFDPRRVAAVCRALDGSALAIELAAARSPSLGLHGLVAGLDDALRVLTSGARVGDRHRSLRDALAWSYDLLDAPDRVLLCGVSAFASAFDVDAAADVARPQAVRPDVVDGLARLAEHNMLVAEPGEPTRYRALETIRQFADEQLLGSGQRDLVRERHRRWCTHQLSALASDEHDTAWCERFDRVATEVRAAIVWAEDQQIAIAVGDLAEQLADGLFLRGQPAEAQRRYEQAAAHSIPGSDRARLLRLAAGAAATRLVGNDALRLLEESAGQARGSGDDAGAAEDLGWMVIYMGQAPGIVAVLPDAEQVARWLEDARIAASGSAVATATVAAATAALLPDADPAVAQLTERAIDLARTAAAPLVESAALDRLCSHHLAHADLAAASEVVRRRGEVLSTVRLDALSGFQFNDHLLMGSEIHVATGDLRLAAHYADSLAELACYREQGYPAIARRIKVDAMAGDLELAVTGGERFLVAWERAGRPRAMTLNTATYAMTMVHGLLGDEQRRRQWNEVTATLMIDPERLTTCATGWAPTFDALVALDRDRPDLAMARLAADIDDQSVWNSWGAAMWRPWYAALWVEAAVLARHPDAPTRLRRGEGATAENPVASAILRRAADLADGNIPALRAHVRTFAELGCRYQQRRTETLLASEGVVDSVRRVR